MKVDEFENAEYRDIINLKVKKVYPEGEDVQLAITLPTYGSKEAACADLRAYGNHVVEPGQRLAIPTGLAFEIPFGYEIQVRSRSGMALKGGLMVANAPGCVDSDYTGEVKVIMYNITDKPVLISHGERIAQINPAKVTKMQFKEVKELTKETERATTGFGSTGVF